MFISTSPAAVHQFDPLKMVISGKQEIFQKDVQISLPSRIWFIHNNYDSAMTAGTIANFSLFNEQIKSLFTNKPCFSYENDEINGR